MTIVGEYHWISRPIPEPQKYFGELERHQRKYTCFKTKAELKAFIRNVSRETSNKVGDGYEIMQFLIRERIIVKDPDGKKLYFDEAHALAQYATALRGLKPALPVVSVPEQIAQILARLGVVVPKKVAVDPSSVPSPQSASQDEGDVDDDDEDEPEATVNPHVEFEGGESIATPSIPEMLTRTEVEDVTVEIAVQELKSVAIDELKRKTPLERAITLTACEKQVWDLLLDATLHQQVIRNHFGEIMLRIGIQADPVEAYGYWKEWLDGCTCDEFVAALLRFTDETAFVTRVGESVAGKDAYQWKRPPYSYLVLPIVAKPFVVADEAFIDFIKQLEMETPSIARFMTDPQHGIAALHEWLRANGYRDTWTGKSVEAFAKDLLWMDGCDESWGFLAKLDDDRVIPAMKGFQAVRPRLGVLDVPSLGFEESRITASVVIEAVEEPVKPVELVVTPEPTPPAVPVVEEPVVVPVPFPSVSVVLLPVEAPKAEVERSGALFDRMLDDLNSLSDEAIRERQKEMREMLEKISVWLEASDMVMRQRSEEYQGRVRKLRQALDKERKNAAVIRQKLAEKRADRDRAQVRLQQLA